MGNIHRELESLRFDIQRERATVNALKRIRGRIYGKESIHSSREKDEQRIMSECGIVPTSPDSADIFLTRAQKRLRQKRDRAAALKEELDTRFPLTPCMLFKLLKEGNPPKQRRSKPRRRSARRRSRSMQG